MADIDTVATTPPAGEESHLNVIVEPEGLLVAGDRNAVDMYHLRKLRFNAVEAIEVAGVDAQAIAGTAVPYRPPSQARPKQSSASRDRWSRY